jgi:hypothetical protein
MSKFRFAFGKNYIILKHYDRLFTKSCDGEPFVLVQNFAPMHQINFFCHNIFFI